MCFELPSYIKTDVNSAPWYSSSRKRIHIRQMKQLETFERSEMTYGIMQHAVAIEQQCESRKNGSRIR